MGHQPLPGPRSNPPSAPESKFCTSCKFYEYAQYSLSVPHRCRKTDPATLNLVTGEELAYEYDASESRISEELCGKDGKWFERADLKAEVKSPVQLSVTGVDTGKEVKPWVVIVGVISGLLAMVGWMVLIQHAA